MEHPLKPTANVAASMRRTSAVALAAALLVTLAAAPAAPGQARRSCTVAGSRTVLSTASVRIYNDRSARPWACRRLTGTRTRLDRFVDPLYAPRDARLGLVRAVGETVAYTWIDPGIPAVFVHSISLRTRRFVRRTRIEPRVVTEPSAVAVTALVVSSTGGVAWIQRVEGVASTWRHDRRGRRLLDGVPRVTGPLHLRGTGLTWRRNGALRRSTLL